MGVPLNGAAKIQTLEPLKLDLKNVQNRYNMTKLGDTKMGISPSNGATKFKLFNLSILSFYFFTFFLFYFFQEKKFCFFTATSRLYKFYTFLNSQTAFICACLTA